MNTNINLSNNARKYFKALIALSNKYDVGITADKDSLQFTFKNTQCKPQVLKATKEGVEILSDDRQHVVYNIK